MKKCTVILNPNSGKKKSKNIPNQIIKILSEYDYETTFFNTEYKGHAKKIIKEQSDDTDLVISIGGDGTFNEVMSGNFKRSKKLVLAHIPLGTTNDIGVMFGYGKSLLGNLKLLLNGQIKKIDICTINDQPFVYVGGFGKFLDVPYLTPTSIKKKIGHMAYLIEGAKSFFDTTPLYEMSYTVDNQTFKGLYSLVIISNANRIAGINNFYKNIKLDDKKFEVLFCNISKKEDLLKTFYYLRTTDINRVPGLYFYKTDNIKIKFLKKPKKSWCIDGEELISSKKEFEIKVVPDIEILMPIKNNKKLFIDKKNI